MNQPPPYPGAVPQQSSGLATCSLVLGILSIVLCIIGPLFGVPAVICGHVAMGRIKRSEGALSGKSLALAGLITGYVSFVLLIPAIGLLAAIAIPNFVKARKTAQMNACINNLRLIDAAKQQWQLENNKTTNSTPTIIDLQPYVGSGGTWLICPAGGSYEINALGELPTCTIPEHELSE